eukprot:2617888-Alexandrium_andersonii.AAC.1
MTWAWTTLSSWPTPRTPWRRKANALARFAGARFRRTRGPPSARPWARTGRSTRPMVRWRRRP